MRLSPAGAVVLAAAAGAVIWAAFSVTIGGPVREAWDTPGWWSVGLPLLALASALLGWLVPERVWRWPLTIAAGQFAAMLFIRPAGGGFGLLPLGVLFVLVPMAIGLTLPALIGGIVACRGWVRGLL